MVTVKQLEKNEREGKQYEHGSHESCDDALNQYSTTFKNKKMTKKGLNARSAGICTVKKKTL